MHHCTTHIHTQGCQASRRKKKDGPLSSFNSSPHPARPSSLPPTLHSHNATTGMARRVLLLLLMAGATTLVAATMRSSGFVGLCSQRRRGTVFLPSRLLSPPPSGSPLDHPNSRHPSSPLLYIAALTTSSSPARPDSRTLPSSATLTTAITTTRLYHSLRVHNLDSLTVEQLKDVSRKEGRK